MARVIQRLMHAYLSTAFQAWHTRMEAQKWMRFVARKVVKRLVHIQIASALNSWRSATRSQKQSRHGFSMADVTFGRRAVRAAFAVWLQTVIRLKSQAQFERLQATLESANALEGQSESAKSAHFAELSSVTRDYEATIEKQSSQLAGMQELHDAAVTKGQVDLARVRRQAEESEARMRSECEQLVQQAEERRVNGQGSERLDSIHYKLQRMLALQDLLIKKERQLENDFMQMHSK
jgi:hypothetical protein